MMNRVHLENDTAAFTCQASGIPIPSVEWYYNGEQLKASPDKYIISSSMQNNKDSVIDTLIILRLELYDVGTYTCNASNLVGFEVNSGLLTLNG